MKKSIFIITFFLLVIIGCFYNKSFASFRSVLGSETHSAPVPSTGPSTPLPTPDPGPAPEITMPSPKVKQTITFYESISGNVFEDLRNMESDIAKNTGMPNANGVRDQNDKPISDIKVELLKGDQVVSTCYTDKNGNYSFSNIEEDGNYRVRFYYGQLDENKMNDTTYVKNTLKYNGQDYFSTLVGGAGSVLDSYTREIMISGKGCTQIFLLIDNSASMITSTYNGKTKVEYQIDAAKKLVKSLLAKDDNIYIGIIAFGGRSVLWQNLTKSESTLMNKLNIMESYAKLGGGIGGATNIKGALELTKESFVNKTEDSNRFIFLLSDGIPLTDGSTEIYSEDLDDDELVRNKLQTIADSTKNKMRQLIKEDIYLSALITMTGEEEIDNLVEYMCDVEKLKFYHADDEEVTKIITQDVRDIIIQNYKENITEISKYLSYFEGQDDKERREEVNNNFSIFNIENTQLFKVIDNYNGSNESKELAKQLSEKTWMSATTGEYTIKKYNAQETEDAYIIDGEKYSKEDYTIYRSGYSNQNLGITLRDLFTLNTEIKVNAIRITLANGQQIVNKINNESAFIDKDLGKGEIKTVENVEEPMCYYIDNEIIQNAVLQVEYTIIVKNVSSIPSSNVMILNYVPEGITMQENLQLLTNPELTNQSYGWRLVDAENEGVCAVTTLNNNELVRDAEIGSNGERYLKIVYSKILSPRTEDSNFLISTEILSYSNPIGRRMQSPSTITVNSQQQLKANSMYVFNKQEMDYSKSMPVIVIPPTGVNLEHSMIEFIATVSLIYIICIVFRKTLKKF